MKKAKEHRVFYIWMKYFGAGLLFYLWYRPKIKNKKVVPKKGPIIICGNHIHVLDQCIPMLAIPRFVHYMAKKEYFDSKFAWFFRIMNCISVNREIHDDIAKGQALDVLNSGYALGIFPEGTRNQVSCKKKIEAELYEYYKDEMSYKKFHKTMKKNQNRVSQINLLKELLDKKKITKKFYIESILNTNKACSKLLNDKKITKEEYADSLLLPTKFGTVSLAQKTGATVCPYVVSGKYKILQHNLKIEFLEPFKVGPKDNLEEKNNHLRDMMIKALAEANKED